MRITFVLPTVGLSGGIRVIVMHARCLAQRGHQVLLISPPPRKLPLRRKVSSLVRGAGWPRDIAAYPSHLDGSGLNHRVLDTWRPIVDRDLPDADVVVATWWETAEWVNALSPQKGVKIYFIQGHEIFPDSPIERVHATYKLPMHKIAVSKWLVEIMRTQYSSQGIVLVPNSIDQGTFYSEKRSKQATPTLGFVYSSALFKGMDTAITAIERLQEQIPHLRILSFGSESPSSQLPQGTQFHYCPPQSEIRTLYSKCDVWLSTSRSEGFCLPVLEGMACRTPCVATRTGWPAEAIVSRQNGILTDVDDISAIVEGLHWVLALPRKEWELLSANAHATATAHSWETSSKLFEKALTNAAARPQ